MEDLIKKIVKEELNKQKNDKQEKDPPTKRIPEVVTRMNTLLNRVANGTSKIGVGKSKFKGITVQVRYLRETFYQISEFISPKEGGGSRFIRFPNKPPTFQELLDRSFEVFFIDGQNYFGEKLENVNIEIFDITENHVDLDQSVSEYLSKRGLYPSKTWFIFKTSPKVKKEIQESEKKEPKLKKESFPTVLSISDSDDSSETSIDSSFSNSLKRKVCQVCSKTYFTTCLNCKQNREFEKSLERDRTKSSTPNLEFKTPSTQDQAGLSSENKEILPSPTIHQSRSVPILPDIQHGNTNHNYARLQETTNALNMKQTIKESKEIKFVNTEEIVRYFQIRIHQGRKLDIDSLEDPLSGETNDITINRDDILKSTFDELSFVTDFRSTFNVDFMAEESVDYGGPRKEWIELCNREIHRIYFESGLRESLSEDYFFVEIMVALAFIQNGPLPVIPNDICDMTLIFKFRVTTMSRARPPFYYIVYFSK